MVVELNPIFLMAIGRGCSQSLRLLSGPSYMVHSTGSLQSAHLLSTRPKGECLLLLLVSFQGMADYIRSIQDNLPFDLLCWILSFDPSDSLSCLIEAWPQ